MRKFRYVFNNGDLIGNNGIVFIEELPMKIISDSRKIRMGRFRCVCGKEFEAIIDNVRLSSKKSCGCIKKGAPYRHGLWLHPIYDLWNNIKKRVFNKKTKEYKNYGGRGISMFPPWIYDVQLFYDYVSALPNYGVKGLTLDRINNDGNYEPGNLRWATWHIQHVNKRQAPNKFGYIGIANNKKRFAARIQNTHIGTYDTIRQAVIARNNYIIAHNLTEYKIQEIII